ncbi:MAG: ComF family protein [Bacteroidota bacterium]
MKTLLSDFAGLFYPNTCQACGNSLYKGEDILCTFCMYHLPKTNYHEDEDNPVIRHFWGKINIFGASSCFFFNKGQKVQKLIHRLKYKGQKEIGLKIGQLYGNELAKNKAFSSADLIVPVPLHKSRLRTRGYNQSDFFAKGLSEAMNIPAETNLIVRNKKTETQTKKNRFSRWENVNEVFSVAPKINIEGKHFLLVDDVITTGSTLTACAEVLLKHKNTKVSIASIAYAYH